MIRQAIPLVAVAGAVVCYGSLAFFVTMTARAPQAQDAINEAGSIGVLVGLVLLAIAGVGLIAEGARD